MTSGAGARCFGLLTAKRGAVEEARSLWMEHLQLGILLLCHELTKNRAYGVKGMNMNLLDLS